jgi:molybdenum cofactor biosynthesis enzyme MoaA
VPDLLFEDIRGARVEDLRPHLCRTEGVGAGVRLHRVTVFLTYGCNLRCPYCKTIARSAEEVRAAPQKRVTYTPADFAALLDGLADMPVQHLHFTGGEAALVPGVVEMVALAKARGIEHVSMTSNGTASTGRYLTLVEAGLTELRLSLDARDETLGAQLTGREGAWTRTVQTFREVAAAREAGALVRLIANVVVGRANREALVPLVGFLLSLAPDDVKLITEVDARDDLADFPTCGEVLRGLEAVLATRPRQALPLLRRKLATVFAVDAIGLPGGRPAAWRCWVPLTERTVDGVAVYPCSVYLREGGAPLAQLEDPAQVQREKTRAWVDAHACGEDPVCRRYCLHCTRSYNDAVNEARSAETLGWLEAGPAGIAAAKTRRVAAVDEQVSTAKDGQPFAGPRACAPAASLMRSARASHPFGEPRTSAPAADARTARVSRPFAPPRASAQAATDLRRLARPADGLQAHAMVEVNATHAAWLQANAPAAASSLRVVRLEPGADPTALALPASESAMRPARLSIALLEEAPPSAAARPFLLLTPLGLETPELLDTLRAAGIAPLQVHTVEDYPKASIALYARYPSLARVEQGLGYQAAWRRRSPNVRAEVWVLDDATFARAWALKPGWRQRWPPQARGALLFRGFHLPDPEDFARQWAWLEAFTP